MHSRIALKVAGLAAAGLGSIVAANSSLAQSTAGVADSAESSLTPAQHLLTDKFVISAGAFVLATHLNGSLNGNATANGISQDVNFDQAFGTNSDSTRIRADFAWHFLPRQSIRFQYFDNDVKKTRTLDKDIVWGDYTFKAAAQATAENKFTVYELDYEYAFLLDPTYEVAATAGVHYSKTTLGISGNASVTLPDGTVEPASFQSKSSSLPAPLPVIGLRGGWAFAPDWLLQASGQFFKVKVSDYDGHWWDLNADVTWMYNNHVGIGAGWDSYTTHVGVDKANFQGHLDFRYSGLVVYLKGAF
jgi:hypothetical protein